MIVCTRCWMLNRVETFRHTKIFPLICLWMRLTKADYYFVTDCFQRFDCTRSIIFRPQSLFTLFSIWRKFEMENLINFDCFVLSKYCYCILNEISHSWILDFLAFHRFQRDGLKLQIAKNNMRNWQSKQKSRFVRKTFPQHYQN